ncbi:MAG: cardiolipin synthase ClsB [Burkholderiaceae bacterium]
MREIPIRLKRRLRPDAARPRPSRGGVAAGQWSVGVRPKFAGGHAITLLRGGDALFPAMGAAIAQAKSSVWVATYIFHDDAVAQTLALVLADAARRGVQVRVVVVGIGSKATLARLREWMVSAGVQLAVFRPIDRWWSYFVPGQARRLHQKLCVVDGEVGFVGGVNLIADRNDLHHGWSDAPRLDFAAQLRGQAVAEVEQAVQAIWTRAMLGRVWRDEVASLVRSAQPAAHARRLAQRLRIVRPHRMTPALPEPPVSLAFVVRDNFRQRRAIERVYMDAIRSARHRVDLVTPYFYPGRAFRHALVRAAERGVKVRLLLQGKIDYRIAGLAARVLYDELLAAGVMIFEYTPAYLHAKVAVVDDDWATVGSSNIDPLSLLLNLEANVVVKDGPFAAKVAEELDTAIAASRAVLAAPYATGWLAVLRRTFVAMVAHWFLRMAGINGRY